MRSCREERAVVAHELKRHKRGERHRYDDQPRKYAVSFFAGLIRVLSDRHDRDLEVRAARRAPVATTATRGERFRGRKPFIKL